MLHLISWSSTIDILVGGWDLNRALPLDGLRALAVIIVMLSHAGFGRFVPGSLGVTIFFFLSGYLITTLLVIEIRRTEKIDFAGFYLRRVIRIVPPMLIAIAVAVLIGQVEPFSPRIEIRSIPGDLAFLTNYLNFTSYHSNLPIPLWSLDVEEYFYLLFPLAFIIVFRARGIDGVAKFCAITCVAVLLVRIATYDGSNMAFLYYSTHTRIDSIIFGCILATFNNPSLGEDSVIDDRFVFLVLGLSLIFLSIIIRSYYFRSVLRYSVQGIGLFFIFNYCLRNTGFIAKLLSHRALRKIAEYSYFLYLIHFPLLEAFSKALPVPRWVSNPIALVAAFVAAFFVNVLVERPLLAWRKRLAKRDAIYDQPRPKGVE